MNMNNGESQPERSFGWVADLRGGEALAKLMRAPCVRSILDVGSGVGAHAAVMRYFAKDVTTISLQEPADYVGDFMEWEGFPGSFDAVWACHVMEHQPDVGAFLAACRRQLRDGGILAVTVPPAKHDIVGGHLSMWNAGLLIYNLIFAGFDCRNARVGTYGYNISVLVTKSEIEFPPLALDCGDINRLAEFFPIPVKDGFDGRLADIRWTS